MREPYETLLGQYRGHWLLWKYLEGTDPDFAGIAADENLMSLSTGELLMLHAALAFYNGDNTARLGALLNGLDDENLERISRAMYLHLEMVRR